MLNHFLSCLFDRKRSLAFATVREVVEYVVHKLLVRRGQHFRCCRTAERQTVASASHHKYVRQYLGDEGFQARCGAHHCGCVVGTISDNVCDGDLQIIERVDECFEQFLRCRFCHFEQRAENSRLATAVSSKNRTTIARHFLVDWSVVSSIIMEKCCSRRIVDNLSFCSGPKLLHTMAVGSWYDCTARSEPLPDISRIL